MILNFSFTGETANESLATLVMVKELFSSATIQDVKELADGYGFRLPLQTPMILKATQYITNERLCCSFFTFRLVVGEQLWLELTGTSAKGSMSRQSQLGSQLVRRYECQGTAAVPIAVSVLADTHHW